MNDEVDMRTIVLNKADRTRMAALCWGAANTALALGDAAGHAEWQRLCFAFKSREEWGLPQPKGEQ